MRQIVGKMAVVTGASRGIGVNIARALAAELEGLAAELRGQGAGASPRPWT